MLILQFSLQFCVSLGAGNTFSKHKWGYQLKNEDPLASYLQTAWNESHLPAANF